MKNINDYILIDLPIVAEWVHDVGVFLFSAMP